MREKTEKKYIIRKTVFATSVYAALKKEREAEIDECYMDENWKREETIEGFRK